MEVLAAGDCQMKLGRHARQKFNQRGMNAFIVNNVIIVQHQGRNLLRKFVDEAGQQKVNRQVLEWFALQGGLDGSAAPGHLPCNSRIEPGRYPHHPTPASEISSSARDFQGKRKGGVRLILTIRYPACCYIATP